MSLPFKIISASSQHSSNNPAQILEQSSTSKPPTGPSSGWISSANPNYPQEILVHLDPAHELNIIKLKRIEILSHHFLIATRVEFFISMNNEHSEYHFKRLGYVKMSTNAKMKYQARELKSIRLDNIAPNAKTPDPVGKILKIKIYDPHPNEYNKYSQVGIVALGFHGESLSPNKFAELDIINQNLAQQNQLLEQQNLAKLQQQNLLNRPKNGPPSANSAEIMNNDPEIGKILQKLDSQKSAAILDENFDECIRIKNVQNYVASVSGEYMKLDSEKRNAIINEDFETAKSLKVKIDQVRLHILQQVSSSGLLDRNEDIEVINRLEIRNHQPMQHARPAPNLPQEAQIIEQPYQKPPTPREFGQNSFEHRQNIENNLAHPSGDHNPYPEEAEFAAKSGAMPNDMDERPIAGGKNIDFSKVTDDSYDPNAGRTEVAAPIKLTQAQRNESEAFIDIFGEEMTMQSYSKKFTDRENLIQQVLTRLRRSVASPEQNDLASPPTTARAILPVLTRLFKDKVGKVFDANAQLFLFICSPGYGLGLGIRVSK